jgi:hypothetical protein
MAWEKVRLYPKKITTVKKAGGIAQELEHPLIKYKALSSKPSTTKGEKKDKILLYKS